MKLFLVRRNGKFKLVDETGAALPNQRSMTIQQPFNEADEITVSFVVDNSHVIIVSDNPGSSRGRASNFEQ